MIKLAVFDLDNTLAKLGEGIKRADIELLKKIEEKGVQIAICSGKPVDYLCGFLRQVELNSPILIGENGAVIQFGIDLPPKRYEKLSYSKIAKESIQYMREQIDALFEDMWYQPNQVGLTPFPKSQEEFVKIEKLLEISQEHLQEVEIYRHVDCFDIIPQGINKQSGLAHLCKIIEISPEEMLAVGDGVNDYPMFAFAGFALGVNVKDAERVNKNFESVTLALEYILTKIEME